MAAAAANHSPPLNPYFVTSLLLYFAFLRNQSPVPTRTSPNTAFPKSLFAVQAFNPIAIAINTAVAKFVIITACAFTTTPYTNHNNTPTRKNVNIAYETSRPPCFQILTICGTNENVVQNPAAVPNKALKPSFVIRPSQTLQTNGVRRFSTAFTIEPSPPSVYQRTHPPTSTANQMFTSAQDSTFLRVDPSASTTNP
jgi:hypothetical protein